MKKIALLFTSVVLLFAFSCKKENGSSLDSTGSIGYKVNGKSYSMSNVNLSNGEGVAFSKQLKGNLISETRYLFNAQKGSNNVILFSIVTDSLKSEKFHYDSASTQQDVLLFLASIMADGQQSMLLYGTDYLDIDISSYKNGHVSGSFSGKFTPLANGVDYNNRGTVDISEGKLNNVPVIY